MNASIVTGLVAGCAKACAKALIGIISDSINSLLPIACETLTKAGVLDPKRMFGVSKLNVIRACAFIGEAAGVHPFKINIPVIGGHSSATIIPLLSQCNPSINFSAKEIKALTDRSQAAETEIVGSATLSKAYAGAHFAISLIRALQGEQNVIGCAYVRSEITETKYFATPLLLGKAGIEKNLGYGQLNAFELELLAKAQTELKKNIESGEEFINKHKD